MRVPIDFEWVHRELRRTGVTLQLLWVEYRDAALAANRCGRPCQYSQFCDLYADFRAKVEVRCARCIAPSEKAFLDYSGKKPTIVDPATGEVIEGCGVNGNPASTRTFPSRAPPRTPPSTYRRR